MALSLQESANLMQDVDMEELRRKYGATGVMIGSKPDGSQALVFTVPKKLSHDEIQTSSVEKIPEIMFPAALAPNLRPFAARINDGEPLPTDVVEEQFHALFLRTPPMTQEMHEAAAQASQNDPWQSCWNSPIPGGVQIQPNGADWVGTAGCAVKYLPESGFRKGIPSIGVLTNYHVASMGKFMAGDLLSQPLWRGMPQNVCARIVNAPGPRRTRVMPAGMVDCALLDAHPHAGGARNSIYGQGATFKPTQLIGKAGSVAPINPSPRFLNAVQENVNVWKSGRTTQFTRGRIAGLGNFTVGYGSFSVSYRSQYAIKPLAGFNQFSAPGDSGSLILDEENRPVALLFAGGDQHTIATPIEYVMRELRFSFVAP